MKKIYLLFLMGFFQCFFSQEDIDKQGLILKEQNSYLQKMPAGNVNNNTLNYDLRYQRMDLSLDPAIYSVQGSVTSHFIPNQNISSIYFDLTTQLTVSQVTFHGNNLTFQQLPTKELKIDFASTLPANTLDSLTIHYSGAPDPQYSAFSTSAQSSIPVMYTLSEPYGAQDWFPTKQSLNDKIEKFEFKINTPSQYSVAANGTLMSETNLVNSRKLTYYKSLYPITAYLVALSITNFTKLNDVIGNPPFPFVNYLYPSTISNTAVMDNIEWTKQAMILFENYFGTYPFRNEKYGHMQFSFNGVCMEHQTMSSMSSFGKGVIAHELAHQWFGDKVTCGAWNDIWLNEGFATFGEHLVNEKLLMTNSEFLNYLAGQKNYITSAAGGSTYVADANLGSVGTIFSGRLTYAKGGFIVRMLKWILTDPVFYQALKDYHQRPNLAYNYARTADLANSLQLSTGRNFTEFFNDWVYGQGYPTYDVRWKQSTVDQSITFQINQTQSHASVSFYEMPLPIKVNGTNGEVAYLKPENTANGQFFTFPLSFTVSSVEFNYEHQILERNSTVTMDNALYTSEFELEQMALFPNPAKNQVFVKGLNKNENFKIFAVDGKLVKSGIYEPSKSINITELVPGNYIIQIKERNLKFIKN